MHFKLLIIKVSYCVPHMIDVAPHLTHLPFVLWDELIQLLKLLTLVRVLFFQSIISFPKTFYSALK